MTLHHRQPPPEVITTLAAAYLTAEIVDRDGVPVLLICDEDLAFEITGEFGIPTRATAGLQRLATAAQELASRLHERTA